MRRPTIVLVLVLLLAPAHAAFGTRPTTQDEPTIEDSELVPVAAEACGSESRLRSRNSDTRTFIRFRNATKRDVTYYWINFDGKRDQKRTLKPGEGYSLWTYLTHPFVVVDAKGACAAVYMPRKEYGLVVIAETED